MSKKQDKTIPDLTIKELALIWRLNDKQKKYLENRIKSEREEAKSQILSKYIEKSRVLEAIGEIEEVGKGTETHVENILRTPPHKIRDKFRAELKTQLGLEEK